MREAHQKVLAVAAALKGEIERLSCPLSQSQPEVKARSKVKTAQDAWIHRMQEEVASSMI